MQCLRLAAMLSVAVAIAPTLAATPSDPTDHAAGVARIDRARLDQALRGFVDSGQVVGVSALVYQDGHEAYSGAFGLADREAARPMARDTIAQIFSMTKPVTGVALMQLYEQGKFQLDDPVLVQIRDQIKGLDINSLTPIEALNKLNEIKKITGI